MYVHDVVCAVMEFLQYNTTLHANFPLPDIASPHP